ncbi:MAG: hypothetical protein ACP5SI_04850 [Chloroflexia bacterium]
MRGLHKAAPERTRGRPEPLGLVIIALLLVLFLLLEDWRLRLRFLALFVALAGLPLLLADFLLDHGLWQHLVTFHALPWSARRFLGHLWDVVSAHPVLFGSGVGLFALEVVRERRASLLPIYLSRRCYPRFPAGRSEAFTTITWKPWPQRAWQPVL